MSRSRLALVAVFTLASLSIASAQTSSAAGADQPRAGLVGDLLRDIEAAETKFVDLAKAMPEAAFEWRPGAGVRSTAETFKHVASDNYLLPALMGTPAPAETGITKEYKTAAAFEKRAMTRDQIITELSKSFAFLKTSLAAMPDSAVDASIEVFGQKSSTRGMLILTATHLHEHLGQLIAYARVNQITPPWSR